MKKSFTYKYPLLSSILSSFSSSSSNIFIPLLQPQTEILTIHLPFTNLTMSSSQGNTGSGSKSSGSGGYNITSTGTNSQVHHISIFSHPPTNHPIFRLLTRRSPKGNHYCHRDYSSGGSEPANSNSYHYSNNDGTLDLPLQPTLLSSS